MLMTGLMIFAGVVLILAKLPRRLMLKALHHDVALDLLVSVLVLFVHCVPFLAWSLGCILAGQGRIEHVALLVVAPVLAYASAGAKRLFGSIHSGRYHPGLFYLDVGETSLR